MLMDFFFLHSDITMKMLSDHTHQGTNSLWATRVACDTENRCSIESSHQGSYLYIDTWTSLCFPYLLIACMASPSYCVHDFSFPFLFQVFFSFFPFPFRFPFSSLLFPLSLLSELRVISLVVSFLLSLCGPHCSVLSLKSLSLPSMLYISARVSCCITLTSPVFSGRENLACRHFSLCPNCAGFSPTPMTTPKLTLEFGVSPKASAHLQWARSCSKPGQTEEVSNGSGEVAHLFPLLLLHALQTGQK